MASIKIFISSHKPSRYVHNDCFWPIQTGAALTDVRLDGFIPDNVGKNISQLNPRFCELTAQYWAWQNVQADYYGFFHYRRYLDFSGKQYAQNAWFNILEPTITKKTATRFGLDEKNLQQTILQYDIILPSIKDLHKMPCSSRTMREQYCDAPDLHEKDLDIMLDVIKKKHPEYLPYAEKYLAGSQSYYCNMFVMRGTLFEAYSAWLFDILFECDKLIDYSGYSQEGMRTPGHLAERLLNIYVARLRERDGIRIKEVPSVEILSTDPAPGLVKLMKCKVATVRAGKK